MGYLAFLGDITASQTLHWLRNTIQARLRALAVVLTSELRTMVLSALEAETLPHRVAL